MRSAEFEEGKVTVVHGKGNRRRTVGPYPGATAIVERWLERRRQLKVSNRSPLPSTIDGKPLRPSYVHTLCPGSGEGRRSTASPWVASSSVRKCHLTRKGRSGVLWSPDSGLRSSLGVEVQSSP